MVRLRTRVQPADVPTWVLSFTPTADFPTPIDWYRKVRDYALESGLIERDLDTWIHVIGTARRVVTATWAPDADRPSLTRAVLTETDTEQKEAQDGR